MRIQGIVWLLCCWSATAVKANEVLIVPIYDFERPPLVVFEDGEVRGIYTDLLKTILKRASIQVEYIPVPRMRNRIMFETGETVISCCDNPAWRDRPNEQRVQLFSLPFYKNRDVFIFPTGKAFPIQDLSSLSDKSVALIRGFGYRGAEWFGEKIYVNDEVAVMDLVGRGRAQLGIVNEAVADYHQQIRNFPVVKGALHDSATVHIRVHRKRQDLLPRIDDAIQAIIDDGTRKQIITRYLQQSAGDENDQNRPLEAPSDTD